MSPLPILPAERRRRMKIDWFLSRGLEASRPAVIEADDPQEGSGLSDHEAIAVTVEARGSPADGAAEKPRR